METTLEESVVFEPRHLSLNLLSSSTRWKRHSKLVAKNLGLPFPVASSQRPIFPGGVRHQHFSSCPPAACCYGLHWGQAQWRGGGSVLLSNPHSLSWMQHSRESWDPDCLHPPSWSGNFRQRETNPGDLKLLLPHPLNSQILKWGCHSKRSVLLSPLPEPELR